jgi:hypothetical protein
VPVSPDIALSDLCRRLQRNLVFPRAPMPDSHQPIMRSLNKSSVKSLLVPPDAEFQLYGSGHGVGFGS